jgi:hypothetical protein
MQNGMLMDCTIGWLLPARPVVDELCAELRVMGIRIGIGYDPFTDIIVVENDPESLETALGTEATVVFSVTEPVFMEGHPSHDRVMGLLPNVHALVAGTPRIAKHLEKLHPFVRVIPVPIENKFFLNEIINSGPSVFFILPINEWSRCSLPTPGLEAMAHGIPIVCLDMEPYNEIITHGKDGFLIQEFTGIENTMESLLTNERDFATIGFMARATASKFNAKSVANQWVSLFQEVRPR